MSTFTFTSKKISLVGRVALFVVALIDVDLIVIGDRKERPRTEMSFSQKDPVIGAVDQRDFYVMIA